MGSDEIIFMSGFDFFTVVKHQRMKSHPASVATITIVSNRKPKEISDFLLF